MATLIQLLLILFREDSALLSGVEALKSSTSTASETERQAVTVEPQGILVPPRKRKFYWGDINSDDFSTPRKAKRAFKIPRKEVSKQRHKVVALKQLNRRLRTRLTNIQSLMKNLKEKNLMNESSQDTITVSCPILYYLF